MARSTNKYHLVVGQEPKRRQCLSSAGGSNVEDKLGCVFVLADGEDLFLMFVKHHVAVLQQVLIFLNVFAGAFNDSVNAYFFLVVRHQLSDDLYEMSVQIGYLVLH